jgi:di/tricarboxylate transporter
MAFPCGWHLERLAPGTYALALTAFGVVVFTAPVPRSFSATSHVAAPRTTPLVPTYRRPPAEEKG